MKTIEPVSVEKLAQLLSYDPETGLMAWKPRAGQSAWNAKHANRAAMSTQHSEGYLIGKVEGRRVYAHRVAFAIHHGRWPAGLIDHVNGDRADNRAANLREVGPSENATNKRAGLPQSGHAGIWWIEGAQRWRVVRRHNGKRHNIGSFADLDEAVQAMRKALTEMQGTQARRARS
jgi:hypothetical protein